jgi:hypothetical protein
MMDLHLFGRPHLRTRIVTIFVAIPGVRMLLVVEPAVAEVG